jgi:hypothetical protein
MRMSIDIEDARTLALIDRKIDPQPKRELDREVYLEYLDEANRLADVLCTDKVVYHKKWERPPRGLIIGYSNVTFSWSRGFNYTTTEGRQIRMRFVKRNDHEGKYPFAETVEMEVTTTEDSDRFHDIAVLHGNGISLPSPNLINYEYLGNADRQLEDIEEFLFAMRMSLSEHLSSGS